MKVKTIPSSWITRDGLRLDCNPYMSGALEARIRLEELSCKKEQLADLTSGYSGGIYNGPQFVRNFVDDPVYGVPFLGTSSMLRADLSNLPLLKKKDAQSSRLSYLKVEPGMTLISCSGTIGRMVYARTDMRGMWSNQDILKVVPDPCKIPPGYLYAFLSCKYGVPLVTSGTYGAIIQHIEPEHIASLPVPRLGEEIEIHVHDLVEEASRALVNYTRLLTKATNKVISRSGLKESRNHEWTSDRTNLGWSEPLVGQESLRALNYEPRTRNYRNKILAREYSELGALCDPRYFKGKIIFKRIDSAPEFGVMLIGQRQAFQIRPEGRYISRKSIEGFGLQVPAGTTLIPSHGTLGENELYCQALIVTPYTSRYAFSGDFFRCIPNCELINPGYLFAFLRSRIAFRMLRGISCGGKQQEQNIHMMRRFPIPRLSRKEEEDIGCLVDEACASYDQAILAEGKARLAVENAVEGAS